MAYLYRHIRLDKNEPFYIGVGGLDKFDNYNRANIRNHRNALWKNISNKTKFEVEILLDDLDTKTALEKEVEFITLYGRIDKGTGTLANMTDGGEGVTGRRYKHSEETKQKLSLSRKRWKFSAEHRLTISQRMTGEKNTKNQ